MSLNLLRDHLQVDGFGDDAVILGILGVGRQELEGLAKRTRLLAPVKAKEREEGEIEKKLMRGRGGKIGGDIIMAWRGHRRLN